MLSFLAFAVSVIFEFPLTKKLLPIRLPDWRVYSHIGNKKPWQLVLYIAIVISLGTTGLLYIGGHLNWLVIAGAVSSLCIGIIGLYAPRDTRFREVAPELIGIAIGVIAIDSLYQIRLEQYEKLQIIRQMGSTSNDFALEAVRLVQQRGWLRDGSLDGEIFISANLRGAYLRYSSLNGVILDQADLHGANLGFAQMKKTSLAGVNLEGANLEYADLQDAYLGSANLANANLWNTYMQGAHLESADLSGANLKDTYLRGAYYSNKTIWPEGFDPGGTGAILVKQEFYR